MTNEDAKDPEATLTQTNSQLAESRELSARSSQPPSSVEGYSFMRQIGEGADGSVWLAREDNTGKQVAIKFYTHRRGLDWSLLNREVEKLAVLYTSRNIVRLLDVGWDSDPPYYVMEYLENGSLASYLSDGPLPANEAVRITKQIAGALVHAHGAGILHCDLKPANVLLDSDFEPRLCDFGQSRLSNSQDPALGTLFYMAREQANLDAVPDARWDVYALGALMYQMLTGEAPHGTPENHERIRKAGSLEERLSIYRDIISQGPAPDKHRKVNGVDRRLAEIISRCLEVDPGKRYPNAQAVLDRLVTRDRSRARKPLILLGIIGPLLLLAALAPIFFNAMTTNVRTLSEQITLRALESDAAVAASEAHTLEVELGLRGVELIEAAKVVGETLDKDKDFQQLRELAESQSKEPDGSGDMKPAPNDPSQFHFEFRKRLEQVEAERPGWLNAVDGQKREAEIRRKSLARGKDTSWFLTDKNGYQLWRNPSFDESNNVRKSLGRNYAWRDYFHGQGTDKDDSIDPIHVTPWCLRSSNKREWHMSVPFISEATDRYMVAITAPVFSESGDFLGMLGRTIHLFELSSSLGASFPDDINRGFALADEKEWKLLDHTLLNEIGAGASETFHELTLDESVRAKIQNTTDDAFKMDDYVDPISTIDHEQAAEWKNYSLAAFSRVNVGDTNWWVIVQESKEAALQPVDDMTSKARWYGWLALLVLIPVICLLWFLVSRAMSVRSGGAWPGRRDDRNGRLTGVSTQ